MSTVTFGKYKGRSVNDVIEADPRYALWAHCNVSFFKLSPGEIQQCVARTSVPRSFPRSPADDYCDHGPDEWGGMSYADFGNN